LLPTAPTFGAGHPAIDADHREQGAIGQIGGGDGGAIGGFGGGDILAVDRHILLQTIEYRVVEDRPPMGIGIHGLRLADLPALGLLEGGGCGG
jgi:hypothetical protein